MERSLESLINSSKEHHHMASRTIFSLMLQSIVSSMVQAQNYEFPTIRGIVVEIYWIHKAPKHSISMSI